MRPKPHVLLALLLACSPAAVFALGPEVGANDFRLSDLGGTGDPAYRGVTPAVAYNSLDREYLVVWRGDDDVGGLLDGEFEIFGQRVDAVTGAELGDNDLWISHTGGVGDVNFGAFVPAVAYNPDDHEYLVVWQGSDNSGGLVVGELEIFGQRLDAATGAEVGVDDFRISDMGGTGNTDYGAGLVAVAYNLVDREYLVVWSGTDNVGGLVQSEREIFAQRLDAATGVELGANDFRISDMGGVGTTSHLADFPAVSHDAGDDEYLVVWHGTDDVGGLVAGEQEVFGQRLAGPSGAEIGANDFRISDVGPNGDPDFDAWRPAVAYNPGDREYLVVWEADDASISSSDEEFEIYAQRIDATSGAQIGANDLRVSVMGEPLDPDFDAQFASVAFSPTTGRYLVAWSGDTNVGGLGEGELEVFAQYLDRSGALVGPESLRVSDMGGTGPNLFSGSDPFLAHGGGEDQFLAVWSGSDDLGMAGSELEIFGQRLLGDAPLFADGLESGDTSVWSSSVP